MNKLHLTNSAQRDATVALGGLPKPPAARLGLPDGEARFRRYLSAAGEGLHEALQAKLGEDYGQALVEGDPEVDLEQVGRRIGQTDVVFLSAEGEVLHASPEIVEVLLGPDGEERERREPQDVPSNVEDETPVRWTGRKLPRAKAVSRFAFKRTLQLRHVDGVTYEYLHAAAKELHEEDAVVLLAAGPKGRSPLVFQANGTPYRGFLEGRVDGPRYQLLLHLSNLELKRV